MGAIAAVLMEAAPGTQEKAHGYGTLYDTTGGFRMRNGRLLQAAMIFLAIVAVFLVFDYSSHVFPWYISAAAALSLAGVYVGIGFTDIARNRRTFAMTISLVAMAIEAVYGTLAVLRRISPEWFAGPQPSWVVWTEAILHGAPFTILLAMIVFLVVHHDDGSEVVSEPIYVVLDKVSEMQQQNQQQVDALTARIDSLSTPALTDTTDRLTLPDSAPDSYDKAALIEQYGSITAAAKALGVSRQWLYAKMNKE